MITLFGQEYAVEAYAEDREKTGELKGAVQMCQNFGASIDEAIRKIAAQFGLSQKDAASYVDEYWKR